MPDPKDMPMLDEKEIARLMDEVAKRIVVGEDVDANTMHIVSKDGRLFMDADVILGAMTEHVFRLTESYLKVKDDESVDDDIVLAMHTGAQAVTFMTKGFMEFKQMVADLAAKKEPAKTDQNFGLYL